MNAIELMMDEHKNIKRMLKIVRKVCFDILKGKEIDFDELNLIINFIRNYADGHHHHKEEIFLFNRMIENLGALGEKTIKNGMLVEHDLGRLYVQNLESAIKNYKEGNEEAKLDIIANAVSYTDLLNRHIDKEDKVIYKFALRELKEDIVKTIDEECKKYEVENDENREKYIKILEDLENKYL